MSAENQHAATEAAARNPAADPRIAALHALLHEHGLSEVRASVAGSHREIAALSAHPHHAVELALLADAIKDLGFLYVALDLEAAEAGS